MKIAVFHNVPTGGAKRTIYEEVKALSKKHTIDLYEFTSTNESFLDTRRFAKKVYRYSFKIESKLHGFLARLEKDYQNFIKLPFVHKRIADKINKGDYDVALVHADRYTQAPFILRYLSIPSLYFCQEWLRLVYEEEFEFKENVAFFKRWYELVTRKIRKEFDRKNAQSASKILANSNFTKSNLKKAYKKDIISCPLGADARALKQVSNKRKNYILFIGEPVEINGYPLLKNAVRLVDKKIRPEIKVIKLRKGNLQIGDDKVLAKEYSNALAVACTSYNEPFGLVPLESMACGAPVLAVNEGGYRETVIDGKVGYLLKRDTRIFAEKIAYLIKHPEVVEKMGREGRRHVIKNFSWGKHVSCLEKQLKELANK